MSISDLPISDAAISDDPIAGTVAFRRLGPGRNPRLLLDFGGGCLRQDVQLFHFLDTAGLYRRAEPDQFNTPYLTVETDDDELRLEAAVRTTDRRISLLYSERDVMAGTLALKRIDSTPYPVKKLPPAAPRFVFNNLAYFPFETGSLFNSPAGTVTQARQIQVVAGASGTIHGIELECASYYPSGYIPTTWVDQIQDYTPGGVIAHGQPVQFPISLTHGGGVMAPLAYRARCRDDSDPLNPCYSLWRYYLVGYWDPADPPGPINGAVASYTTLSPLSPDVCVCPTPPSSYVKGGRTVRMETEQYYIGAMGSGLCGGGTCVQATAFPTAGGPIHHWLYRRRSYTSIIFTDENLRVFAFPLLGLESSSSGEGAPVVSLGSAQFPLDFE